MNNNKEKYARISVANHGTQDNATVDVLKNQSVFSAEVQRELLLCAQKGDIKARNTLMESNIPFVIKIAKQFSCVDGIAIEELISEGYLGLHEAINKFNIRKQNNFISYAFFWIRYYINKSIRNNSMIRKPANKIREIKIIYKIKNERQNNNKSYVHSHQTEEEYISWVLNISKKGLDRIMASSQNTVSLDTCISGDTVIDSDSSTIGDMIADDSAINPENHTIDREIKSFLEICFNFFPKRDIDIIKYHYGMVDGKIFSLEELSKKYNLSKERIRQIEQKTLQKLKYMFKNLKFD